MYDIKIKSNKIIVNEELFDGYLYILGNKIAQITKENFSAKKELDYTDKYVSAGFIESHTHGAGGCSFIDNTVDDVIKACECHLRHGTTTIFPTVTTGSFESMRKGVINIDKAIKSKKCKSNIIGAHLEGPYLSLAQVGGQNPNFITPPKKEEYEKLVEEYGDSIARWTYAPENDKDFEFTKFLKAHNINASAGHTNAIYDDMKGAVENGCNLITHLYSATSTVTREQGFRRLGVIESAYLMDELYVELICDGKHLPPELIQMIIKIKGTDKVILTTDSLSVACTDTKEDTTSGTGFIVEDGVCKLLDRSAFAGSIATCDRLIRVLHFECGFEIPVAVKMLTKIPAKLFNLDNKGTLESGKDADIVVFDDDINVENVFVNGEEVIFD